MEKTQKKIRRNVLWPSLAIVMAATIIGLLDGSRLSDIFQTVFDCSIDSLGWAYQLVTASAFVIVFIMTVSEMGNIRIGGKDAISKFGFSKWFAMNLTGGIATGIVTYSVVHPLSLFTNISGELNGFGIVAGSAEASVFSLAHVFHEWTFVPYAVFSISGICAAYVCYNQGKALSVASTLTPLLGERMTTERSQAVVDTLCVLAMIFGLAGSLGSGITLIATGLNTIYGISETRILLFFIAAAFTLLYMLAMIRGLDRGIQVLADLNTKLYYLFMILLFLIGPTLYLINNITTAFGYWLRELPLWLMDVGSIGGEALVRWWTISNWTFFIAFAPVTGIFLAKLAYGRTIREFMFANWVCPSLFSIIWYGIWGGTAIKWEKDGVVDFFNAMQQDGSLCAIWKFVEHLPLSRLLIPIVMIIIIMSFATAADTNISTIASLCIRDTQMRDEAPNWIKVIWGLLSALISYLLIAFTEDQTGLAGIKALGSVGGLFMLIIVILQLFSTVVLFFKKGNL